MPPRGLPMLLCAMLVPLALANGQTSHQHITVDAVPLLPPGELADFLARDDVRDALLNGAMFPDGGYAVGDDYGEMAHWEPLQDLYLRWILENHPAPFDDEGARHVAFYLGMLSHGMADQLYDATYMERSRAWDPAESWVEYSMDEATDVAYAAIRGEGIVPERWWPRDMLPLFEERGHVVEEDTVDQGQQLLGLAIRYVGASSGYEDTVARYTAQFPWACTHQTDSDVVGNPPHEAEVVAAYWQVAWERLNGRDGWGAPVIAAEPADGGWLQERDHTSPDARLAVVFAKGLDPESLEALGRVTVIRAADGGAEGAGVPVDVHVFYGWASHVVNVIPLQDWEPDTDYVVTIAPGVRTFDGVETSEPISWTFSTRAPPAEDTGDGGGPGAAGSSAGDGCGCAAGPGGVGGHVVSWGVLALMAARRRRPSA